MNKIVKYLSLVVGWIFVFLSLTTIVLFHNTKKSIILGAIGTFILFLQSLIVIRKEESETKSVNIVSKKLNIIYLIISILLAVLYFI